MICSKKESIVFENKCLDELNVLKPVNNIEAPINPLPNQFSRMWTDV